MRAVLSGAARRARAAERAGRSCLVSLLSLWVCSACSTGAPPEELRRQSSLSVMGERLFRQGLDTRGRSVPARGVAGVEMESRQLPCAQCHGADGLGGQEGNVIVPELRWRSLAGPGLPRRGDPAERATYREDSLARALRDGVDPQGRRLNPLMPRYALGKEDVQALVAFLRRLDAAPAPGVTEDTVQLGMLRPQQGVAQAGWEGLLERLQERLSTVNAQGGVFGRRILLRGIDSGASPASALAAAERERESVLCFVANAGAGASPVVSEGLDRQGMLVVGPLQVHPAAPAAALDRVFHVLPTLDQLGAALARLAAKRLPPGSAGAPLPLLVGAGAPEGFLARGLAAQARVLGLPIQQEHLREGEPGGRELGNVVEQLRSASPAAVALATDAPTSARLLREMVRRRFTPLVLASSELSGAVWEERVPLHVVTPARVARGVRDELLELEPPPPREPAAAEGDAQAADETHALEPTALIALDVALEALKRAGHQLSRTRLLSALRSMQGYRSLHSAPIRFGPRDRAGAARVSAFEFDASGTLRGHTLLGLD